MNNSQRSRIRSLSRQAALGLALALSACATRAPAPAPEPPAPVAESVRALSYTVTVIAVDADTDLGNLNEMITQALVEDGYKIAESSSDADVVLAASLVATRVNGGMTVVVNGEERVQRDMKLTLRAQAPADESVVDQTTRAFSTKEPRVPVAEVAAAVNALGAGGKLDVYARDLVANAEAAAKAQADAEAAAAAEAAEAEALAAKTRGCKQLDTAKADSILKNFEREETVRLHMMAMVFNPKTKWCDIEETQANVARVIAGAKNAPRFQGGESSKRMTPLAKKKLLRAEVEGVEFVKAVSTAKKKNFVNQYGASMGTIRRVAVVTSVGDGAACFMIRGNWRVSTLMADQDDPEYVKLDWENSTMPALLVECPKS